MLYALSFKKTHFINSVNINKCNLGNNRDNRDYKISKIKYTQNIKTLYIKFIQEKSNK